MTQLIFDPAPEEVKKPHITDDVQPAAVQEHVGQEGEVMIERKTMNIGPLWIGILRRNKTEEIEEILQDIGGKGYFKEENGEIQNDKNPCDGRKSEPRDGVPKGYHNRM